MTNAYAAIANSGTYIAPTFYTKITDHYGNVLLTKSQESHRVISESTAYLLTSAMAGSMKEGTIKGTWLEPSSISAALEKMPAAGKSGTSTDGAGKSRDYWFLGYTRYYTMGVWSGFDDGSIPLQDNVEMNNYHKAVWKAVMDRIHEDKRVLGFVVPREITTARICSLSGKLAVPGVCDQDPNCRVYSEVFTKGTEPTEYCTTHKLVTMCRDTGHEANPYCKNTYTKIYYNMPVTDVITLDSDYIYRPGSSPMICQVHTEPVTEPPTEPVPPSDLEEETLPEETYPIYDENGNPIFYDYDETETNPENETYPDDN
jgi:penicillin-binding protein 1A